MENPLYVGLSSQVALRRQLDVVAHNVANMNTVGFRAERVVFDDVLERAGAGTEGAVAFTVDRATYTDLRSGGLQQTGNPLDVAIQGDGWLRVMTADGERYTRDGRLQRDDEGRLVTVGGLPVLDDGGAEIRLPETGLLEISADGGIAVDGQAVARLGLVRFDGPQGMLREADGLYRTDEAALPAPETRIVQGAVEGSNVEPVVEMVRLIDLSRAYERVDRMVDNADELQRTAVSRLGKTPG